MNDDNLAVCIRAQRDLFGGGRLELADEVIAPDFVDHEAPDGAPGGPEGVRRTVAWLRGAFSDLSYEVEDAIAAGDRVAVRCTASGTHDGEFMGRSATHRRFAVKHTHWFRVDGGLIAEHWAVRDDLGMMRQLGLGEAR